MSTVPAPPLVYRVEESEHIIRLSIGGVEVCAHPHNTPQGIALLQFDAEQQELTASREAAQAIASLPADGGGGRVIRNVEDARANLHEVLSEVRADIARARQAEAPPLASSPPYDCCPICGGDCAAANPPVLHCPMKEAPPLASGAEAMREACAAWHDEQARTCDRGALTAPPERRSGFREFAHEHRQHAAAIRALPLPEHAPAAPPLASGAEAMPLTMEEIERKLVEQREYNQVLIDAYAKIKSALDAGGLHDAARAIEALQAEAIAARPAEAMRDALEEAHRDMRHALHRIREKNPRDAKSILEAAQEAIARALKAAHPPAQPGERTGLSSDDATRLYELLMDYNDERGHVILTQAEALALPEYLEANGFVIRALPKAALPLPEHAPPAQPGERTGQPSRAFGDVTALTTFFEQEIPNISGRLIGTDRARKLALDVFSILDPPPEAAPPRSPAEGGREP